MRARNTLGLSPLDLLDNSEEATGEGGSRFLFKGRGEQGQCQVKELPLASILHPYDAKIETIIVTNL